MKDEKSIPYTPSDFDSVNDTLYNKWHNIRYKVEKVEIREGEIFFTVDGKEYDSASLAENFDERYSEHTFGDDYYYLPAGMRERKLFSKQITEKFNSLKKVCPYCKSKKIISSEEPRELFDFGSSTPTGTYIKCEDCGFTLHTGNFSDDGEKLKVFGEFVDRWNMLVLKNSASD